ncbi:MAG: PD-(D/E)XK nuclease family protein [Pseudomonadota bacterium]
MIPLVSLFFHGRTLTEHDDLGPNAGLLGRPVWGRMGLLSDLELRLGMPRPSEAHGVRLQQWSRRLSELEAQKGGCFYSRSYAADPVGTARTLLAWRDALIEAGWDETRIEGGGERLDTLAELEVGLALMPGTPERLRRVVAELEASRIRPWKALELAEERAAWPGLWQRLFAALEACGTPVRVREPALSAHAPRDSDLGRLQAALRGEAAPEGFGGDGSLVLLRGETSWELSQAVAALLASAGEARRVVVRGGDPRPLDMALAAQGLARHGVESRSVWRPALQLLPLAVELLYTPRDPYRVLELVTLPFGPFEGFVGRRLAGALARAPGIGGRAWREAKEAIANAIAARVESRLAAERGDAEAARAEGLAAATARLEQIAEWLEQPGYDANAGAPREALIEVTQRVTSWLQGRLARAAMDAKRAEARDAQRAAPTARAAESAEARAASDAQRADPTPMAAESAEATATDTERTEATAPNAHGAEAAAMDTERTATRAHERAMLGAALAQANAFAEALAHDPHEILDLVAARQLLQEVSLGPATLTLAREEAGRLDWVEAPSGLRVSRDVVVWWHCVNGTQSGAPVDPWRRAERAALAKAGVKLPDVRTLLAAEAAGWRGVVLAAKQRLVLVVPSAAQGERLDPHPIWDEIVARANATSEDVARITLSTEHLLARRGLAEKLPELPARALAPLALPEARPAWNVDGHALGTFARYTATSLEALVGCPLHWVFGHRARLASGWTTRIPSGPLLNGRLGHRLIEELYREGALDDPAAAAGRARALIDRLIAEEAAVLLRPGMTFELSQLREQLVRAVERFAELLAESGLAITDVEAVSRVEWRGRALDGRLDLLLRDARGDEVVLDLKWGRGSYRTKLERGLAVQLAVYAASRKLARQAATLPPAGYFSLGQGELLTTERAAFGAVRALSGPALEETWEKLERTVAALETALARGPVPATGLKCSLPLLESIGVEDAERERYLEAEPPCEYCSHTALCGKAWEGLA